MRSGGIDVDAGADDVSSNVSVNRMPPLDVVRWAQVQLVTAESVRTKRYQNRWCRETGGDRVCQDAAREVMCLGSVCGGVGDHIGDIRVSATGGCTLAWTDRVGGEHHGGCGDVLCHARSDSLVAFLSGFVSFAMGRRSRAGERRGVAAIESCSLAQVVVIATVAGLHGVAQDGKAARGLFRRIGVLIRASISWCCSFALHPAKLITNIQAWSLIV